MKHTHAHPPAAPAVATTATPAGTTTPSLLMASAGQRLLGALALLALLWSAVAWALHD